MSENIESRLLALRLILPPVSQTRGSFKPFVIAGNMLYLSGKGAPLRDAVDRVPTVGATPDFTDHPDPGSLRYHRTSAFNHRKQTHVVAD